MSQHFPETHLKLPNARLTWQLALVSALCSVIELMISITGPNPLSGLSQILGIVSLLCTFIFYYRSAIVARILMPRRLFSEPLWLIIAFITPVLNLVLPWVMLRRVWRTTATAAGYQPNAGIVALHLWWAAFIFAAALIIQHLIVDVFPILAQGQANQQSITLPPRPMHTHIAYIGQLLIFVWMAERLTRLQSDVVKNQTGNR